jgi:hydroxymethylpyrimidine kinase/phosphomethylpyrimidine kinase/thiamine-phosphate diphosphorylase
VGDSSDSSPPIVWTIAGSDSSGGGGIQADIKTISALGAHGCSVITAITAQNSSEIRYIEMTSVDSLRAQFRALAGDLPPRAIKIGMSGGLAQVETIVAELNPIEIPIVCDPVLVSSSGTPLLAPEALSFLKAHLFPLVRILTPNLAEAESLVGYPLTSPSLIENAAQDLMRLGIKSVVIKGGHGTSDRSQDFFFDGVRSAWLHSMRQDVLPPRGTGCTFSSALATSLAFGYDDLDAVVIAKTWVSQCIRLARSLGQGAPLLQYQSWPSTPADFPWLTLDAESGGRVVKFPDCGPEKLGFYPIVDRYDWLARLLPLGVKTAQLRIKDLRGLEVEQEIRRSIQLARDYQCRLFINDYSEIALNHGAYGVHLGQEDLKSAPLAELSKANLRLGLSTHCFAEVARARAIRPSYLAIGPIFPTTLKAMPFAPQGLAAFQKWCKLLPDRLVAIGGMTLENSLPFWDAGADGIAVVSDITRNPNPEGRAQNWLARVGRTN